ncbi:aldehyde dehydrogenase family 1 member A3 [Plectosphaerella plurivora]|uniref:aldehyde dehydrogenase (NAD(+)) n=1 Tax=Plectosphaerella plurivora TaxID=936078 RepID=A0A9P9A9U1_9PEZI|nr:aldehyde dehydrogenase family 1 member A3 [Plectosphaerella plurivora]
MDFETGLFINNEYVSSASGETISVYNPADDTLVTDKIQVAGPEDRAAIINKYADLVEKHADQLALLETTNIGAPVASFRYYAGLVDKVHGETYNEDSDSLFKIITYEPLGNGTYLSIGWKIAPAVAIGNTFVYKSSERDPLGALFLGRLFKEAGFPPSVVNLLLGDGKTGALLVSYIDITRISFTSSIAAGRKVKFVNTYIKGAKAEGIKVLRPGNYLGLTLLLNPPLDSKVWKEEIFRPVLVVRTFKTEEEVLEQANDTDYGLSGIIFTSDISRALRVASKLDAWE